MAKKQLVISTYVEAKANIVKYLLSKLDIQRNIFISLGGSKMPDEDADLILNVNSGRYTKKETKKIWSKYNTILHQTEMIPTWFVFFYSLFYPVVEKPGGYSSKSKGVQIKRFAIPRKGFIYEKYFEADKEFRFHVNEKLRMDITGNTPPENFDQDEMCALLVHIKEPRSKKKEVKIFNIKNCIYKKLEDKEFRFLWPMFIQPAQLSCRLALSAIEYDMGAFDIKLNSKTWEYRIIEVNAGPGMGRHTQEFYQRSLMSLLIKNGTKIKETKKCDAHIRRSAP